MPWVRGWGAVDPWQAHSVVQLICKRAPHFRRIQKNEIVEDAVCGFRCEESISHQYDDITDEQDQCNRVEEEKQD